MSTKKKVFVLTSMVALLIVTAVFNFILVNASEKTSGGTGTSNLSFFAEYKLERQKIRNQEVIYLDEIISTAGEALDVKVNALNQKLKISGVMEQELLLESLIKAKGFPEVVVTIGVSSDIVSVLVKDAELSREDVAVIYNIVKSECKIAPENVRIMPIA